MEKFVIEGGVKLKGGVRLGGAKNASFKLMIASLIAEEQVGLLNLSNIGDVETVNEIMKSLGAKTERRGLRTLYVSPNDMDKFEIPYEYGEKSRASIMFAGPLLHKFGKAIIPFPGGDKIGKRPLDRHFGALKQLGAQIEETERGVILTAKKLTGSTIRFPKNTHTGTENAIIAAVVADGITTIENAAVEPEVDDLISFLNKMGGKISRKPDKIIRIEGVKNLNGAIHKIMPDRNEAVTYACAAIGTKGDIVVENAKPKHLEHFLKKLDEANGGYEIDSYGIRFFYKGKIKPVQMTTRIHPGFMTDWQPLWVSLMLHAEGDSKIIESIYESRFGYVDELRKVGAKIDYFDPKPENPEVFYNFNFNPEDDHSSHGIKIHGPANLKPLSTEIKDVRFGATLVLTALSINGVSELTNVMHIDRGYEDLDGRLKQLGAKIERVIE